MGSLQIHKQSCECTCTGSHGGVCASVRQLCSVDRLSSVHLWTCLSVSILPVSPSAYQPLRLLTFLLFSLPTSDGDLCPALHAHCTWWPCVLSNWRSAPSLLTATQYLFFGIANFIESNSFCRSFLCFHSSAAALLPQKVSAPRGLSLR